MGNETSSSLGDDSNFMREFKSQYDYTTELNDKRFGDVCIYRHKTEKKYIAKRGHMCNSTDEYQSFIRSCKQRQNLKQKSLLQLLFSQEANEDNICGDFNKITLYFEYYFHDLEKEIFRRRENGQEYFSESELWYLLDSLIEVCSYLQKYKIYHGDLRPCNILLSNEGLVKIADHGILNTDQTSYYKMLSNRDKCYLSPMLLRSLRAGEHKPFHDSYKTDMYSLGMSILEAASLCPPMAAYDFQNFNISHPILEELLNDCRTRYSDFLVNVLMDMLQDDESTRPSFESIKSLLLPFQNSIQNNTQLQRNSVLFTTTQPVQFNQQQQVHQVYQQAQPSQNQQNYSNNQNMIKKSIAFVPPNQPAQVALQNGSASFVAFNAQDPYGTQQSQLNQSTLPQQTILQNQNIEQQQLQQQTLAQYQQQQLQLQQLQLQIQQQQQVSQNTLNPQLSSWQIQSPSTTVPINGNILQNAKQTTLMVNSLPNQLLQQQQQQQGQPAISNNKVTFQPTAYTAPIRSPANPHSQGSIINPSQQTQHQQPQQQQLYSTIQPSFQSQNQLSLSPLQFQTPQQDNHTQEEIATQTLPKQYSAVKQQDNSEFKQNADTTETVSTQGIQNNSQTRPFQGVQLFQQVQSPLEQQQYLNTTGLSQLQQQQLLLSQLQQQQILQNQLLAQQESIQKQQPQQQQQQSYQQQQQLNYQLIQPQQPILQQTSNPITTSLPLQQQQLQQPNKQIIQQQSESLQHPPLKIIKGINEGTQDQQQSQQLQYLEQASVQFGSVQSPSQQSIGLARQSLENTFQQGQQPQYEQTSNILPQQFTSLNPSLLQNYSLQGQQSQQQQQQQSYQQSQQIPVFQQRP